MAEGNVEIWLGKLLSMSLRSTHGVIRIAMLTIDDANFDLLDFLNTYPSQVAHVTGHSVDHKGRHQASNGSCP